MKQYIDKSAVLAEIEKLQDSTMDEDGNFYTAKAQAEYNVLCMLENSINNIEVEHDTFIEKACEWFKSHGSFTIGFDGATFRDFLNFINK